MSLTLTQDKDGSMTSKSPSPAYVAQILTGIYTESQKLEKLYKLLIQDYNSENDFYSLLSDISDVMDEIDMSALTDIKSAFGMGIMYSEAERWIIPAMYSLWDDSMSVYTDTDGTQKSVPKSSVLRTVMEIVEDCDYVNESTLKTIASELYSCIAAMYVEIYNTYDLQRFVKTEDEDDLTLPQILDTTRGFNEFLIKQNKSIEEMAEYIFNKTQEYVFVANEVDRDKEVSEKIRAMVPADLKSEFEDSIELITAEQVEDLLNGKIKITREFIYSLSEAEEDRQ